MFYRLKKWISSIGSEKIRCPRRDEGPAGLMFPGPDHWRPGKTHWESRKSDYWPADYLKPRTCSFCGGVNISDAIHLIKKGWEIEPSTKDYKWYLNPPGYYEHCIKLRSAIGNQERTNQVFKESKYKSAIPPVKIYGMHASAEQIKELNRLYDKQKVIRLHNQKGVLN